MTFRGTVDHLTIRVRSKISVRASVMQYGQQFECFERRAQCSVMPILALRVPKGAFDFIQTRKEASVLWLLASTWAGCPREGFGSSAGKVLLRYAHPLLEGPAPDVCRSAVQQ